MTLVSLSRRTISRFNKGSFWIGTTGFYASILVAVGAAAVAFLNPFNSSPADKWWAVIFALLFAGLGVLVWLNRSSLLLKLSAWSLGLFLLAVIFFSDNGPALLGLVWLTLLAASMGTKVFTWLGLPLKQQPFERLLLATTLGLGILAVIPLALGSAHFLAPYLPLPGRFFRLLHPVPTYAALILLTLLLVPGFLRTFQPISQQMIRQAKNGWRKGDRRFLALWSASMAICALSILVWALSPTIRYDALVYHLGAPEIYIRSRGIIEVPEPVQFYWAHYAEMLFTLGLLVAKQPLPSLLHFLTGLLAAGLTFTLGKRVGGTRVGLAAALIFYSLPILYDSGTAHNDFMVTLFTFAAFYALLVWWQDGEKGWPAAAGLLAGFAFGSKFNAAIVLFPVGLFFLSGLVKRWGIKSQTIAGLFSFGLPALLLFAPWGIRDWVWTENPVFPFLNSVFQSPQWVTDGTFTQTTYASRFVSNFLLLPWSLTVNSARYYIENSGGIAGGLMLFALPWTYLTTPHLPRRVRRFAAASIIFTMIVFFIFVPFSQRVRYLLPIFPLLSVLAALNIEVLWQSFASGPHRKGFLVLGTSLALVYLFSTRLAFTTCGFQLPERYPYTVALGTESPEDFLSRNLSTYDAFQFLENEGDGNHKVAMIGSEDFTYTRSRISVVYSSELLPSILQSASNEQQLAEALLEEGFQYILLDRGGIATFPHIYNFPLLSKVFFDDYTELAFARNNVYVYRLLPFGEGKKVSLSQNILANTSFEGSDEQAEIANWELYNDPIVDTTGEQSRSGQAAVKVSEQSFISQQVEIEPGRLYTLGYWARADQPQQQSRLQIMWRDHHLVTVDTSGFPVDSGQDWQWVEMSVTAPEEAAYARVYAIAQGESQVWIDDICFAPGEGCEP